VTANVHLFEGLFALPQPVDLLMDGRSIEGIDFDALGALLDWIRTHLPRIRPRIRRRVGVISAGAAGMVLAGISPVLGWTADVSMAPDVASGLRELGAANPEALAAEVDALVAGLRDTPALLVDLRVLLRARRGNLSLAEAARELGVSTRSLQRAVAQAGSSYRAEEFDARLDAALELLRSDAKIASIASRLGVTEGALARLVRQRRRARTRSSSTRRLRRWTSPSRGTRHRPARRSSVGATSATRRACSAIRTGASSSSRA
jgi:AraC-like DNA-binding protein